MDDPACAAPPVVPAVIAGAGFPAIAPALVPAAETAFVPALATTVPEVPLLPATATAVLEPAVGTAEPSWPDCGGCTPFVAVPALLGACGALLQASVASAMR
jgi:hypothetical protein